MIKILYEDRKIIEEMYNSQMPVNRIAARINVARNTLYKELKRGGVTKPSDLYSADLAPVSYTHLSMKMYWQKN